MISEVIFLVLGALLGFLLPRWWDASRVRKRKKKDAQLYNPYIGLFLAFRKYEPSTNDEYCWRCLEITCENNIFKITGINRKDNPDLSGEITMDRNMPKFGTGYYQHESSQDGIVKFGFYTIQLAHNDFLVHETIFDHRTKSDKNGRPLPATQISDPFRWVKVDKERWERCKTLLKNQQNPAKSPKDRLF